MLLQDLTFGHQSHILDPRRMRLDGNPSVLDRVAGMDPGGKRLGKDGTVDNTLLRLI